jgi:hypothetical protein
MATTSLRSAIRRRLLRSTFTIQISLTKLFSWCKKVAVLLTPAAMQTIAGFSSTTDMESNCRQTLAEKMDGGIVIVAVAFFMGVRVIVPAPAGDSIMRSVVRIMFLTWVAGEESLGGGIATNARGYTTLLIPRFQAFAPRADFICRTITGNTGLRWMLAAR